MPFADLHCDTSTECFKGGKDLLRNDLFLSFSKAPFKKYLQVAAIFIPDELRNEDAEIYFQRNMDFLKRQTEKHSDKFILVKSANDLKSAEESGKIGIVPVIEGLGFKKDIKRTESLLRENGIRFATLTWNGENNIAGGVNTSKDLTSYGKEVLSMLCQNKIVADVSHLNEKSFWSVLENTKGKIAATHSLSAAVYPHKRNLTDEQIKALYEKKGIVGLNLYPEFIKGESCESKDIFPHIERFLELGGEELLGFGSDFDGAEMPSDLKSIEDMEGFLDKLKGFLKCDRLFEKITYKNVRNFIYDAF